VVKLFLSGNQPIGTGVSRVTTHDALLVLGTHQLYLAAMEAFGRMVKKNRSIPSMLPKITVLS
jgi:hypothetical protein